MKTIMNNGRQRSEEYGEFKGSVSTKLDMLFVEIKDLRKDVDSLKGWKFWSMGFGAAAGLFATFVRDFFTKK